MTRYEVAQRYAPALQALYKAGLVQNNEIRRMEIYDDIMRLNADGLKMTYCVHYAAERYGMSAMQVWRIVRYFREQVPKIY